MKAIDADKKWLCDHFCENLDHIKFSDWVTRMVKDSEKNWMQGSMLKKKCYWRENESRKF